ADHRYLPRLHPGAHAPGGAQLHGQPGRPRRSAFARGGAGLGRPGAGGRLTWAGPPPSRPGAALWRAEMRRGVYTLALYAAAPLAWLWMARRARRAGGDWGIFSAARFGRAD